MTVPKLAQIPSSEEEGEESRGRKPPAERPNKAEQLPSITHPKESRKPQAPSWGSRDEPPREAEGVPGTQDYPPPRYQHPQARRKVRDKHTHLPTTAPLRKLQYQVSSIELSNFPPPSHNYPRKAPTATTGVLVGRYSGNSPNQKQTKVWVGPAAFWEL